MFKTLSQISEVQELAEFSLQITLDELVTFSTQNSHYDSLWI